MSSCTAINFLKEECILKLCIVTADVDIPKYGSATVVANA